MFYNSLLLLMNFWSRSSVPFRRITDPDPATDPAPDPTKIEKILYFFILSKIYFSKNDFFLLFMYVKYKFNFFVKKLYNLLVILVDFCENSSWFWLVFASRNRFRIRIMKRIRIRLAEILRIQTDLDLDPQHWFYYYL